MNRCEQCKVLIMDDTEVCPLCRCVCTEEPSLKEQIRSRYPNIRLREKKLGLFSRIVLFVSIVAAASCIILNYIMESTTWWSLVVAGGLAYAQLILFFMIENDHAGYRSKVLIGAAGGIAYIVLVDEIFGYTRWSLNYAVPAVLLIMDIMIIVIMIVNARNWQSYLLFQIFMILCSGICVLLCIFGKITNPIMSYVVFGFSCLLFLATLIIGGRRAANELKRRFHV